MTYKPEPLDTSGITLPRELDALAERLARNTHELWAQRRMREGWRPGDRRDNRRRTHPNLVPYHDLAESEKAYDRMVVNEVLKSLVKLGYAVRREERGTRAAEAEQA